MTNNFFTICSFFYSLMLTIIYFRRKNIGTLETKIYSGIVITNFLNVCFAIFSFLTIFLENISPFINNFISKTLLLLFITWEIFFTLYVIAVTEKDEIKVKKSLKDKRIFLAIFYIILISFIYSLPLYYHSENNIVFSYGPSANLIYFLTAILIVFWIIKIFKNFEILKSKKCIPIVLFIILTIIVVVIQKINPGLLLITATETFITVIMYFTIENPDMKLLEEVHKSKEISDAANEEKTLFLYNMTQEIRNTTNEINNNADLILESDSIDENKENAREIKTITSKFMSTTNEILDVSKIDSATIKVYNEKYNLKTIIKEIVSMYSNVCKKMSIDFRTSIEHNIPDMLYGDSIGLKEVLKVILDNSVKYTSKGFIELSVNTITKNDICRLIITIEDSGIGIKSEDINRINTLDKSLSKANKLITLMNGTLFITSNYGSGTKIKIILDQKIEENNDETIKKYERIYNDTKILVIDDSEASQKIIEKLLRGSNIVLDYVSTGRDAVNKIKAKNRYELILLDEELSQISGEELLKKFISLRNFNIPVILLSKDNKYEYSEEYITMGFSDFLLKPIKKEDLLEVIEKFAKREKL